MTISNHGPGRTLPAGGTEGQFVIVVDAADNDIAFGDASDASYIAAVTADWATTVPTTIGQALDLIAAAITLP